MNMKTMLPRWLNCNNEWNHDDRVEQIRNGWITTQHYKTQCFEIPKYKGFTIGFPTEQLWSKFISTGPELSGLQHDFQTYAQWYIRYHQPTNQWKDLIPKCTNVPSMVPFYELFSQIKSNVKVVGIPTDEEIADFDCYFYDACCDLKLGNVSVNRLKSVNWLFDTYKDQSKGMLRSRCKSLLFDAFVFYVSCRSLFKAPEWIEKSDGKEYLLNIDEENITSRREKYAAQFQLKKSSEKRHHENFDDIFDEVEKNHIKLKPIYWTQQDPRIDTQLMNTMQLHYIYTFHYKDDSSDTYVAELVPHEAEPWFAELEECYK
jgi:hypothetical protein